jgi:hypothetical protein
MYVYGEPEMNGAGAFLFCLRWFFKVETQASVESIARRNSVVHFIAPLQLMEVRTRSFAPGFQLPTVTEHVLQKLSCAPHFVFEQRFRAVSLFFVPWTFPCYHPHPWSYRKCVVVLAPLLIFMCESAGM